MFTTNPSFLALQGIEIDFFDFQFVMNADGTMKECKHGEQILEPAIGQSLFQIKQKYFKKNKKLKELKQKSENHKKEREARGEHKAHLQEHIKKSESKLTEYKNTILAFGKLATCNGITK